MMKAPFNLMSQVAWLLLTATTASCSLVGLGPENSDREMPLSRANAPIVAPAKVCDIRANRNKYIGQLVRVEGVFRSDGMTYSLFQDARCEERNSIGLSSFTLVTGDNSVREAIAKINESCNAISGHCSQKFFLDVDAQVLENERGQIYLDLKHVHKIQSEGGGGS